jgi:hypothetical protein
LKWTDAPAAADGLTGGARGRGHGDRLDIFVADGSLLRHNRDGTFDVQPLNRNTVSDATKEAEAAVKALREAKDKEGQRKAAEALDKAMKKLREGLK